MKALIVNCSPVRNGATALIAQIVKEEISPRYDVKCVSIDDYDFAFCRGCRTCHGTAACVMDDGVGKLMAEFESADAVVCVSPSYWADVPGQFKAFIDRCTPWCDTHEPHASIGSGKKGWAIALRTGPGMRECERIIQTIEHFYGHLSIECAGRAGLCGVSCREDAEARRKEIEELCRGI